jgi:hypothetical protein
VRIAVRTGRNLSTFVSFGKPETKYFLF